MAPGFSLPLLERAGSMVSLSESHGKVRYIDFWASWCAPCRVSIPQIIALQHELGKVNFKVIGINVDEQVGDALDFLRRHPTNYINLSDSEGRTAGAYALRGMPMSFVIDQEGRVTLAHMGFKRGDMMAIRNHIIEQIVALREESP